MPTSHTAIRSYRMRVEYRCGHCGHTAPVEVIGATSGSSTTTLIHSDDAARATADQQALASVPSDARIVLGICKCPRCGRRRGSAVAQFWAKHVAIMGAVLGVGGVVVVAVSPLEHPIMGAVLFGVTLLATWAYWWAVGPLGTFRDAAWQVKFLAE